MSSVVKTSMDHGRLTGRYPAGFHDGISPLKSACRTATCEAVGNDCLTRMKLIGPCVPSHVAYEVGAARQQTVRSPRTMYPRSRERHRNREATVYLPA